MVELRRPDGDCQRHEAAYIQSPHLVSEHIAGQPVLAADPVNRAMSRPSMALDAPQQDVEEAIVSGVGEGDENMEEVIEQEGYCTRDPASLCAISPTLTPDLHPV